MKHTRHPVLRIAGATLVLGLIIAAITVPLIKHNQAASDTSDRLRVVAAENFWGNITEQIGGEHVTVTSIISDPSADPHLYESSADNAQAVSNADLVIANGAGYDDFMDKLVGASRSGDRTVLTVADVLDKRGDDVNPHLWYDLPQIPRVADAITAQLIAKDGAHKADYERNAARFKASMQPLLNQVADIKQTAGGQGVAYTEPVAGYLLEAAGLQVKSPASFSQAIEDGTEPSPSDTQRMNELFASKQVKALLYNSQAVSQVTERVQTAARNDGVAVVGVTETMPPQFKTYQSWQQSQLDALQKAVTAP